MLKLLLYIVKSEKGLCALAFMLALLAVFEGFVFHGLEFAKDVGLFKPALAATLEEKK